MQTSGRSYREIDNTCPSVIAERRSAFLLNALQATTAMQFRDAKSPGTPAPPGRYLSNRHHVCRI
jgi:hypothetical protein